ncbi:MAG: hypothetical protein KF889_23415 [Alphaproteobacteria bacterium]|nr:hypothetical protein [Alphaproteobacteria bacterium]MCW5742884.1 hypothetical protein [Alphaproteobacteria bacterium]
MRGWRAALGSIAIAATASTTGCASLIGNCIQIAMQVVEPSSNFIDRALAHRYSDWYSIGSNTPDFGERVPVWRIAEQANRRLAEGCEPMNERSCAYRKVLRGIEERQETERRLMTLHFMLSPNAAKGCATCVEIHLAVDGRVTRATRS